MLLPKKVENTICNIAQITFTDVYYSNHNKAGRVRNKIIRKDTKNLDKYQDITATNNRGKLRCCCKLGSAYSGLQWLQWSGC